MDVATAEVSFPGRVRCHSGRAEKQSRSPSSLIHLQTASRGARVIQIDARTAHRDVVVNHLFSRARDKGAAAVPGLVQSGQLQTLIDPRCLLRGRTSYALVHSRDKGVRAATSPARRGCSSWRAKLPSTYGIGLNRLLWLRTASGIPETLCDGCVTDEAAATQEKQNLRNRVGLRRLACDIVNCSENQHT